MKYNVISSNSSGNAIIVEDFLLLDCGLPYKKLATYLDKIKVIFISHKHADHLNKTTIKRISFEYPNIKFICGKYLVSTLVRLGIKEKNILMLDIGKWYSIGIFKVKLDSLTHDIPNCCIHIEFKDKTKLLYAVDTANLDNIVAKNYDYYFVESNYDEDEIETREQLEELKTRIKNTHLSKQQCDKFLMENMGDNSQHIYCHQHIEKEKEN